MEGQSANPEQLLAAFTVKDLNGLRADGLRKILLTRKDQFRKCLVEKLLTFATGRGLEKSDRPAVDKLCQKSVEKKDRFADIILEVAKSEPLRKRKNAGGSK